jgi:PAS domain S-box-containing protein
MLIEQRQENQDDTPMSQLTSFDTGQLIAELLHAAVRNGQSIAQYTDELSAPCVIVQPSQGEGFGGIRHVNTAFEQLIGQSREALVGAAMDRLDNDPEPETDGLTEKLSQSGYATLSRNLKLADGGSLRVERTVVRIPDNRGTGASGDVLVIFDRPLEGILPPAGGADLSQSQAIALKMETLLRRYIRENYRQGMHPAQWSALRYFKLAPPEARSLTGFARAHHTTMGTASTTVSTLVSKGYLQKHSFRGAVNLTKKGEALLRDDPLGNVVTALNRMSAFERDWAEYVLTALTDSFGSNEDS